MQQFTRRSFLKSTAAGVLAPAVLVKTTRAAEANERLTLGFIGVGTQGRSHLGAFLGRKEVEVVAVCDVVKERLDSAAATGAPTLMAIAGEVDSSQCRKVSSTA